MENIVSEKSSILFYPGCYVYSSKVMRRTIRLLDHVGNPYGILGGLTTCCGTPHLLQGEFDQADECYDELYEKIKKIDPAIILTGCAECFEALIHIKEKYQETFEVLTVVEYLMRHIDKFPAIKVRTMVTLQDSCRLTRHYKRDEASRKAISYFSALNEMEHNKASAYCCYHWNHGYDKANKKNRKNLLNEASQVATTMACDCLTCSEEYKKIHGPVEVIDVLELFDEALTKGNQKNQEQLEPKGLTNEDQT
jgi:Fe-S oxidoreductase